MHRFDAAAITSRQISDFTTAERLPFVSLSRFGDEGRTAFVLSMRRNALTFPATP